MAFDDLRTQVEADPKTGDMPLMVGFHPVIAIKNFIKVVWFNTHAFIFYADCNLVVFYRARNLDILPFGEYLMALLMKLDTEPILPGPRSTLQAGTRRNGSGDF